MECLCARWRCSRFLIQDGIKLHYLQVKLSNTILESLNNMLIRESVQLQTVLAMYEQEIDQDRSKPSSQKLITIVRRDIDQMIRTRNFKVRNERIETGVLVKNQKKENVSNERKPGECYRWKAKRTMFSKRSLQFPPRRQSAWQDSTIVSPCSKNADTKTTFERKRPQRKHESVV